MQYKDLVNNMTLAEKCAFLSGKDVWHTRAFQHLGIPSITLSDGPSGLRKQAATGDHLGLNASVPATCMPSPSTLANSWDIEMLEAVGAAIGAEAVEQDVQVLLGPGLNTKRNPLCGRNFEYYSEDPYLSGKLAAGFVRGAQKSGVAACVKHFAANNQETCRMHSDSVMDERTLRELYLTGFEIAVKEGKAQAVMSAYNRVNGVYANENNHLLQDVLGKEWGFEGIVVTDWGGSNDFVEGVRAGMNLEMPASGDDSACQLIKAVEDGRIPESLVDERVHQLLALVLKEKTSVSPSALDSMRPRQIAQAAAEASIVLLKNSESALPLSPNASVAVIGDFAWLPRYQGAGSSTVNPTELECLKDLLLDTFSHLVGCARGFLRTDGEDAALSAQAEALAKDAEWVVLCLGLTESYEIEGMERKHMRLPGNQIDLLKRLAVVNKNIIVVLSAGSAVEMPWLPYCKALVYAGLGGQAGAGALLRVLTGKACPCGKLAETFPLHWEDLPSSCYYPGKEATAEYREGIYVGYRALETSRTRVLFPFGYGLSYTTFAYHNLSADSRGVRFEITNTGAYAGSEIAQLYVSLPDAKVFRPVKELKGFTKVQLAPGETKAVTIPLDDKAFRYFNVATNRFEVEGGEYHLQIGANIKDISLQAVLTVQGSGAPNPYESVDFSVYKQANVANVPDSAFRALLGREIPESHWNRNALLTMNDTVSQLFYARNPLARLLWRILSHKIGQKTAAGKPDLNLLFIYNIPFRGIAKMMNGMVSMRMAEALLLMANGHAFRGLGRVLHGFFHRPSLKKCTKTNTEKIR